MDLILHLILLCYFRVITPLVKKFAQDQTLMAVTIHHPPDSYDVLEPD